MVTQKHDFLYTANFCEENIWKLGQRLVASEKTPTLKYVLLLSNHERHIPLYHQQHSSQGQPVIWDYHVILLDANKQLIYDFDSHLPFPIAANHYFQETVMSSAIPEWRVWVRAIPLPDYLAHFSSNRAHMLTQNAALPSVWPDYPPIIAQTQPITLMRYLDFEQDITGCLLFQATQYAGWVKAIP